MISKVKRGKRVVKRELKAEQEAELRALAAKKRVLKAAEVVEFARDPKTACHSWFEWDDTAAAQRYRLWQAEHLIASVTIIPHPDTNKKTRCYVSLVSDRSEAGGGYRKIVDVLSNQQQRAELLAQAWRDFRYWQEQYQALRELEPIFTAAEFLAKEMEKPMPAKAKAKKRKSARERELATV